MNVIKTNTPSRPVKRSRDGSCHLWRVGRAWIVLLGLMGVAGVGSVEAVVSYGETAESVAATSRSAYEAGVPPSSGQTPATMPGGAGRRIAVSLDRFGRYQLDGEPVERLDMLGELRDALSREGEWAVDVTVAAGALPADVAELTDVLRQAGEGDDRIQVVRSDRPAIPPNDPKAAAEFIAAQAELHRALLERISEEHGRLSSGLLCRRGELERRAAVARTYLDRVRNWLRKATSGDSTTRPAR